MGGETIFQSEIKLAFFSFFALFLSPELLPFQRCQLLSYSLPCSRLQGAAEKGETTLRLPPREIPDGGALLSGPPMGPSGVEGCERVGVGSGF